MSDPIEIIDKVIAVSKMIYGVVKSIKGAPDELKNIDREISRVLPILEHVLKTLGSRVQEENRDRDARALQGLCDEARELVEVARGFLQSSTDGTYRLRKKEWTRWLMKKPCREDLAKRFHNLHGSVSAYLSYDVHREVSGLKDEVRAQSVELRSVRADIHGSVSAIRTDIARHRDRYSQRDEQICYLAAQLVMRSAAESQTRELNQYYDQVTTYATGFTQPTLIGTSMNTLQSNYGPFTSIQDMDAYPRDSCDDICLPSCRCRCHRPPVSLVPHLLRPAVGSVYLDHDWISALLSARTPCNEQGCKRHRSNLLKIKYYCPTWFAQIDAEIRTERIPLHFIIQTPRIVRSLTWLEYGTLDDVRRKLWSHELTVNDMEQHGDSVLHRVTTRLLYDRSEMVLSIIALLEEHSVPTDWESNGLTPVEHAFWFTLLLWRSYGSHEAALNMLKLRIGLYLQQDIEETYEQITAKLRWTTLHRRICFSSRSALTYVPPELGSQVNVEDSLGWTPLLYAVLVCTEAVYALLSAGADPRIDNCIVVWAARAGADVTISMLVRAGADPNWSDVDGLTALHRAANPNSDFSFNGLAVAVELVRHAGHLLDWGARDSDGMTPLVWAQRRARCQSHDEDSKLILELYRTRRVPDGAQYVPASVIDDTRDEIAGDGSTGLPPTSLIRAGLRGDVDAIGTLIRQGAMVNEHDHEGHTLLHLVALGKVPNGYRVALELVRHGGYAVNWHARTVSGRRASDFARHRLWEATRNKTPETSPEYKELKKITDLLKARRLPAGEKYLWPCMDPNFFKPKHKPVLRMPGAWDE